MNIRKKTVLVAFCLLISASVGMAGQKGRGDDKGKNHSGADVSAAVSVRASVDIFVENDRGVIRRHFLADSGNLPPGLAKRGGDLPPGLEKQLRRNGHLPPGLEKKLQPFPVELEKKLPPLKPGLVRGIIGVSAVIMNKNTSIILDVFKVF